MTQAIGRSRMGRGNIPMSTYILLMAGDCFGSLTLYTWRYPMCESRSLHFTCCDVRSLALLHLYISLYMDKVRDFILP